MNQPRSEAEGEVTKGYKRLEIFPALGETFLMIHIIVLKK